MNRCITDMEQVPSVSRSSGLEPGGDALKDAKMQEDYRNFIDEKLRRYWTQYPPANHLTTKTVDAQQIAQSNLQILIRKLREGLMASQRIDEFTLEVYETSLHLSLLFRTPTQTTSIIGQLLPHGHGGGGIYNELDTSRAAQPSPGLLSNAFTEMSLKGSKSQAIKSPPRQIYCPPQARRGQPPRSSPKSNVRLTGGFSPPAGPQIHLPRRGTMRTTYITTVLMSLLHTLLHFYPSQAAYQSQLKSHRDFQSGKGDKGVRNPHQWLKSLSTALASRNYARCERLTRLTEVEAVCRSLDRSHSHPLDTRHPEVWRFAIKCLVVDLRMKVARETAWVVLATAYRDWDITQSGVWLSRSLMVDMEVQRDGPALTAVEGWLRERGEMEVKRKEGVEGRWILCKRGRVP